LLHLDQSGRYVGLAELSGELLLVDDVACHFHSFDVLPPCCRWSSEEVGGEQHLLVLSNSGYLQIFVDGAEPVVRVERCDALGEIGGLVF
jgi:hypothetical protein